MNRRRRTVVALACAGTLAGCVTVADDEAGRQTLAALHLATTDV